MVDVPKLGLHAFLVLGSGFCSGGLGLRLRDMWVWDFGITIGAFLI